MASLISTHRVDADNVKEIFTTLMTGAQINAFINMASRLVTNQIAGQVVLGTNDMLDDDTLKDIELLLSAHFCALNDPRAESESIAGEYSYKSQGKTDMMLDATFYGQQAKLLDVTGTLDRLGETRRKATIQVLSDVYK